jgi:hypothetical protein
VKETVMRHAASVLLLIVLIGLLASLSRAPWTPPGARQAMLRLSWRATGTPVESCRRLTAEELERLPAHMRQEEVCEGRIAPFGLTVRVDGRTLSDDTIQASGARRDRPVYVMRDFILQPGEHELEVIFQVLGLTGSDIEQRQERPGTSFPALLAFRSEISVVPGRVVLVTYDESERALVARARN